MKKLATLLLRLLMLLIVLPVSAQINLVKNDSMNLNFYGFFQFDAAYQSFMMNSYNAPRYPLPNTIDNDESTTNFSAMHTRFGLRWDGPEVYDDAIVKGCLEWDLFDPASRNQMKFRVRLAYLELKGKSYSILAGQHWDLFAAGLPYTLITNGFYWETGNIGFRRAQLRYTRFWEKGELAISASDPSTDGAIKNGTPLLSARYAYKFSNKGYVGISTIYGKEDIKTGVHPDRIENSVLIWGVSLDAKIPFAERFSLLGELTRGQNLKPFLSRSGFLYDAVDEKYRGMGTIAGWLEFLYSVEKFDFYVGYARENLTEEKYLADGALEDAGAAFIGLIHKLGRGVSYGVEVTRFNGTYKEAENSESTQVLLSAKYAF
jgi:hypothetical protein